MGVRTAAALIIGNEVLSGKVEEKNAELLIRELRALGVTLGRLVYTPDVQEDIAEEVARMSARYDVVFTSGGIGVTHDDVTVPAVAQALGRTLVESEALAAAFARLGKDRSDQRWRRMLLVPEGADLLELPGLPFPILRAANVYVLPGVPEFFEAKFRALAPSLAGTPIHSEAVYLNVSEWDFAEALETVARDFPALEFGSYPRFDTDRYRVKVTVDGRSEADVARGVTAFRAAIPAEWVVEQA